MIQIEPGPKDKQFWQETISLKGSCEPKVGCLQYRVTKANSYENL